MNLSQQHLQQQLRLREPAVTLTMTILTTSNQPHQPRHNNPLKRSRQHFPHHRACPLHHSQ